MKYDIKLKESAETAINTVLKIKQQEKVLIITNPEDEVFEISQALFSACMNAGAVPIIICQPQKSQMDFAEDAVINAMTSEPDVIISMSSVKMGKDRKAILKPYEYNGKKYDHIFHLLKDGKKTVRSFWSPGITKDIFIRTTTIDYVELDQNCKNIKAVLDKAVKVKIVNKLGTNIEIGLNNRTAFSDDGDFSQGGRGGNLPAGEVFISPELNTSNGLIVFDGSISSHQGDIVIKTPIKAKVENGFVTTISGSEEASELLNTITLGEENAILFEKQGKLEKGKGESYKKNARNLGELGIGLNPNARIIGNMLEDEKAANTCHIAIGSNYDDDAPSLIHLDGLITKPTITAIYDNGEEIIILENGGLVV